MLTCDSDDLLGGTACLARGPRGSVRRGDTVQDVAHGGWSKKGNTCPHGLALKCVRVAVSLFGAVSLSDDFFPFTSLIFLAQRVLDS